MLHERKFRFRVSRRTLLRILSACLLASAVAVPLQAQECFDVMRFQDGVFPSSMYSGTRDSWIRGTSPTENNGMADRVIIDGVDGSFERSSLVRWDISSLPAGATIEAAVLTFSVRNQSPDPYGVFEALRPWTEGSVTWNQFDAGMPWTTAGAKGVGTDRGATLLGTTPSDNQTGIRTVVLNADGVQLVQDWLDGTQPNNGFVLFGDGMVGSDGVNLRSREEPNANLRPMLAVYYTTGGPSCSPLTCFAVADGGNRTVSMSSIGEFTDIGAAGVPDIEAIALALDGTTLWAADAEQMGLINTATGAFSPVGTGLGTAGGSLGEIALIDADSLTFDPLTDIFYGVHRRAGADLLFQIDTATGAHIPNAFGPGVDYVPVGIVDLGGGVLLEDIDDIAIDPASGLMYGIANAPPNGDQDHLLRIDKSTGAVVDLGATATTTGAIVEDIEGLGFYNDGSFYASTGDLSTIFDYEDTFWFLDKTNAILIPIAGFEGTYTDYESLDCLRAGQNTLSGTVFIDDNTDGVFNGSDTGIPNIEVRIYIDENNDGMVDPGDTLIIVLETDMNGDYTHTIAVEGNFVVDINTSDPDFPVGMPGGLTTDNIEEADFAGWGNDDPNNDFGWNALVPVELMTFTIE